MQFPFKKKFKIKQENTEVRDLLDAFVSSYQRIIEKKLFTQGKEDSVQEQHREFSNPIQKNLIDNLQDLVNKVPPSEDAKGKLPLTSLSKLDTIGK